MLKENITYRPVSDLESIIGEKFNVLDHGFVRVVDYMGNDASIVQAARVSYNLQENFKRTDSGLIDYLMRNRHTSPFEMCEIKLHCKLPIFVARQWIRHRTASVNEVSGRYSILPDEFYIPASEDIKPQSRNNKQGRSEDNKLSFAVITNFLESLSTSCKNAFSVYNRATTADVSKELARIGLPLSTYTEWYWKIDLHNLLHFLKLRMDPHAQLEIRQYANVISEIIEKWVPFTYRSFQNHVLNSTILSQSEVAVLREHLNGDLIGLPDDLSRKLLVHKDKEI